MIGQVATLTPWFLSSAAIADLMDSAQITGQRVSLFTGAG